MGELTPKDLEILKEYADSGNRERYWSYLAHKEHSDGYGLLALGVVRNDNLPGQVANAYAQSQARDQHDRNPALQNRNLTEREWEAFGQTLLHRDLERREHWMEAKRPDLALNLPGRDVQQAHDEAFKRHHLDPNCWTPRVLLEATRKERGEGKAEEVWKEMLNNDVGGTQRAFNTLGSAYLAMPVLSATGYIGRLGLYEGSLMAEALPSSDPNIIGSRSSYHMYSEKERAWYLQVPGSIPLREHNPKIIASLDDARAVRLERAEKATHFHPEDNYRTHLDTPKVVLNEPLERDDRGTQLAANRADHANDPVYQQIRDQVASLQAEHGPVLGNDPDGVTARLAVLAKENNLNQVDHVMLGKANGPGGAGQNLFLVQGALDDPAHQRVAMPAEQAVQAPVEQSYRQLDALAQRQAQDVESAQPVQRDAMRMA